MPLPSPSTRQAVMLTALLWRFRIGNALSQLRALRVPDKVILFGGTPVVAVYGLWRAGTWLSRQPVSATMLGLVWFLAGVVIAGPSVWLHAQAIRRRLDRSWLLALPLAPDTRARLIDVEQTATGIVQMLCLAFPVGTMTRIADLPHPGVQAGVACGGYAFGALLGAAAERLAHRHRYRTSGSSTRPVVPQTGFSRRLLDRLLARLDRATPRWCSRWALGGRAPFVDTGLIWFVAALAIGGALAAAFGDTPEAAVVACAALSHLVFVATLRSRILRATALRALPIGFGSAVSGILRGPLTLSLTIFCTGATIAMVVHPHLAGTGIAGLAALTLSDLAYLCFSLACGGRERLGFTNYTAAVAIGVSNLPQFGAVGELAIVLPGLAALVWHARRRFLAQAR